MSPPLLPVPDESSAPYWQACAEHVLKLPCCSRCNAFTLPPDITCPHCHSLEPEFTWQPVVRAADGVRLGHAGHCARRVSH